MKTQQNIKMTKEDFKLRKEIKGIYVAKGYHKGKHYVVHCEYIECDKAFSVIVFGDRKPVRMRDGVRLKDVKSWLANERSWLLSKG